ncbi:DUF5615 family PIN-like protein [Nonomuraea sp. NPDC050394]|uniref:DUF5615 family PIN-like protein n=1 Tax=Nonomuraea sp. NPDC050394 TaxID=3364363 RepID=UPI00379D34E8
MRRLLDQNVQQMLLGLLKGAGIDAMHTDALGMARWGDEEIFAWCCAEGRVLVTSDKRLTKYLAVSRATCPSVIVLRDFRTLTSKQVAR